MEDLQLPEGFKLISRFTNGRKRQYVICTKMVYSPQGTAYPCNFCTRKDNLLKAKEKEKNTQASMFEPKY